MSLHSWSWFADMRVTWQRGVTSMNALAGAVCNDDSGFHRPWASYRRVATGQKPSQINV